ncbi:uncharacterized protein B0I36DRAFT_365069 [Microdochium trichocladiopsis]|uniref:Nudix hydrolase domain-containing protein n=1 Tax=Microdochium trichocladiopsis TaxID=1682393 RepID=A0A9P9BNP1_9PEZI|nr:uncharacterized protein B0I36DRAFT_365069 [Microdochium trichocladiopsis]KAH7027941.1 hypothetical protein B0I36DRAFT_365069 [Microdochium trichocladiopsis]
MTSTASRGAADAIFPDARRDMQTTSAPAPSSSTTTNAGVTRRVVAASFIFKTSPDVAANDAGAGDTPPVSSIEQVALFRRSGKVRTYQHKLAPVSGSMDASLDNNNPLLTAIREIREETGLVASSGSSPQRQRDDLELILAGKPYRLLDDEIGREWLIHPFSWRLRGERGEQRITIDWEHEGWEWHDPLAVSDSEAFGGVPKLAKSLRRVWPAADLGAVAGRLLMAGLRELKDDHDNGARQLATRAVMILKDVVEHMDMAQGIYHVDNGDDNNDESERYWESLRMAAWHLCANGRPSMGAAITSAILTSLARIEPVVADETTSLPQKQNQILSILSDQITERSATTSLIQQSFQDYIAQLIRDKHAALHKQQEQSPDTNRGKRPAISVLTLSLSSTITGSLLQILRTCDVHLDLRILESRPRFEGVTCAAKLLEETQQQTQARNDKESSSSSSSPAGDEKKKGCGTLEISIFPDAAVSHAARDGVDVVLLGADRISAGGDVSNKTGSLAAVLCARELSSSSSSSEEHPAVKPSPRVVVLSETDKVARSGEKDGHVVEENDAAEVTAAWSSDADTKVARVEEVLSRLTGRNGRGSGVSAEKDARKSQVVVKNIYFEWVPSRLVDGYVTELGVWSTEDIAQRSAWIGEEEEKFFGGL